jgi:anaerobic selenocysteine-containing dehydrogenase
VPRRLTPTWNESAWFADYVLPMGHAGERHDLMSQETHAGQWIAFRQPVRRVAWSALGSEVVRFTYEANPGEVWEENEFWIELSVRMDPDGSWAFASGLKALTGLMKLSAWTSTTVGSSRIASPACPKLLPGRTSPRWPTCANTAASR